MKINKNIFLIILVLFTGAVLNAQQEEVKVVKPYTPTLSGAEKIQLLPEIEDSVAYDQPEFEYSIYSKRYNTDYQVTPIKPAKMVRPALPKLYKSELNVGIGNYLTPLAELRINQVRSSKGTFGVLLRHHSMNGKVKLDNDEKVDAGFNQNNFTLGGKRFKANSTFSYGAGLSYDIYQHYGVDTSFSDQVNREDMGHDFFSGTAEIGWSSSRPDSLHLDYDTKLKYSFFTHAFDQMEHAVVFDASGEKNVSNFRLGGELGASYNGHQDTWDPLLTNQVMIKVNPYITKSTSEWMFRAGINTYTELRNGDVLPHFHLSGKFAFNIVKEVLVPYFGVDGYQEMNNYQKMIRENPYVVPGTVILPTNHKLIGFVGLKGRITDFLAWNIQGSYSNVDNQYFYVTDTTNALHNQFNVVYDSMTVLNLHAELNIAPASSLRVLVKGNYFNYELQNEAYAWYKPEYDVGVQARYNLGDKILADAGIFLIGPKYYPALSAGDPPGKLPISFDLNLGLEYRYTKLLSFWAKFNNITAQPYYMWYNYPSYRFRFMLGFTYGL